MASSTDGTKLVAVQSNNGYIYTFAGSGVTWTAAMSAGRGSWQSVASSSDGTKLVAAQSNSGYIYTSADFGATVQAIGIIFR
jgi:DNA-binding beta-propeller fold protein YncE